MEDDKKIFTNKNLSNYFDSEAEKKEFKYNKEG